MIEQGQSGSRMSSWAVMKLPDPRSGGVLHQHMGRRAGRARFGRVLVSGWC